MKRIFLAIVVAASVCLFGCGEQEVGKSDNNGSSVNINNDGLIKINGKVVSVAGNNDQIKGSGVLKTTQLDVKDFTQLNISNAFSVSLSQGNDYSVEITTDDNIAPYLIAKKDGNRFVLGLEAGNYDGLMLKAKVSMPTISTIKVLGGAVLNVQALTNEQHLNLEVNGASKAVFKEMNARHLSADVSGASSVIVDHGQGEALELTVSGASKVKQGNFQARTADVKLSGASKASLHVSERLDYLLDGASSLTYSGSPELGRQKTSGASTVIAQ